MKQLILGLPRHRKALSVPILIVLGLVTPDVGAQSADFGLESKSVYDQTSEIGPHHRRWTWRESGFDPLAGEKGAIHHYTELQAGLHYWRDGGWAPSKEWIELADDGAQAVMGLHQVRFAANLNTAGSIRLKMPDGQEVASHVQGLIYYDAASGQSVVLASV